VLNRVFSALAASGATWAEQTSGFAPHAAWATLAWVLSIMASLGIVTGALFLMPVVTAFVGSFFVDEVADAVERDTYPAEPPGQALPLFRALIEGVTFALLALAVYILCRGRRGHSVPGQCLPARPRIFRARRHALPPAA
jgi:CysZ protein